MVKAKSDPDVDSNESVWASLSGVMGSPFGGGGEGDELKEAVTTTWSSLSGVPDVLRNLGPTAKGLLRNPRDTVIGIVVVWAITSILGFSLNVLALIQQAFALVAGIPATVAGAFGNAGGILQGGLFGALDAVTAAFVSGIGQLGWAAPLVFALVYVVWRETAEEVTWPLLNAGTDLLGAIPVLGSILDAGATFLVGLAERVWGGFRG